MAVASESSDGDKLTTKYRVTLTTSNHGPMLKAHTRYNG